MPDPISREEKRDAALREIKMRRLVYPGRIADGRMTEAQAEREIELMVAIAADYAPADLFGGA